MPERKPLVIIDGDVQELPLGDTVPSSSTGGVHTIQDNGVSVTQRPKLNFTNASINDDSINEATVVSFRRNVDGGTASSVYLPSQRINGGYANG